MGFSQRGLSKVYIELFAKKNPVSDRYVGKNAVLMPEVREEWPDGFQMI